MDRSERAWPYRSIRSHCHWQARTGAPALSDGVVTFVTEAWLWVVPRCELRAAQVKIVARDTLFEIKLEHGHELKAVCVTTVMRGQSSNEWRYRETAAGGVVEFA